MYSIYFLSSVRVHKKSVSEAPYREIAIAGKAPEDPRLVALYKRHLELYHSNSGCRLMCYQTKVASDVLLDLAKELNALKHQAPLTPP
jgi:hypothetical protein